MKTGKPNHGCHRYKSSRKPVPWVLSSCVVRAHSTYNSWPCEPHDIAGCRRYWRARERAGTRRVAEDGAVLARALATGASERLADAPRSGAPATYTPEQI